MMRVNFKVIGLLVLIGLILFACANNERCLNNMQIIGSHNSYKIAIEEPLWEHLYSQKPSKAMSLQYGHVPIYEQLELGLRSLELDVFHDPKGGHYSNPRGLDTLAKKGIQALDYDIENKLSQPGLKMCHIQDIDFRSHHLLFKDCLLELENWSEQHANHMPIIILINTKDTKVEGCRDPLPFTKEALDSVDLEIRSVFSYRKLITPDLVRRDCSTLEEAILKNGWPELEDVRGRFLFVLDEKSDKINSYLQGHTSLTGRVMFVNSPEGRPEAAFRILNNPIRDFDYIKELVDKGYMVRTRADVSTKESRTCDYTRFHKAMESGAQVISTDYYIPTTLYDSDFKISFENNNYERLK